MRDTATGSRVRADSIFLERERATCGKSASIAQGAQPW
jgi:hypothetical protein